jgi:outer membrane lipopolysaccharide assembly protein LptE/RlpB
MKNIFLLAVVLLLSACGAKLTGVYVNNSNNRSLTFNSDGTAYESNAGVKISEFSYSLDGNSIKINGNKSPYVLLEDGSIGGVALGKFSKK